MNLVVKKIKEEIHWITMSAQEVFITGIFDSFSTFCLQNGISAEVSREASVLLLSLLRIAGNTKRAKISSDTLTTLLNEQTTHSTHAKEAILRFFARYPISQASVLIRQFVLALASTGCSSSTIRNYRSDINQFFVFANNFELDNTLVKPKLEQFVLNENQNGSSIATIKRKLSSLTQFSLWLEEVGAAPQGSYAWLQDINKKYGAQLDKGLPGTALAQTANSVTESKLQPKRIAKQSRRFPSLSNLLPKNLGGTQAVSLSPLGTRLPTDGIEHQDYRHQLKTNFQALRSGLAKKTDRWMVTYFNLAAMALFFIGLSYFGYLQFYKNTAPTLAFPTSLTRPNRVLSFQGRLTDTSETPITSATTMRFKLYDSGPSTSGGTQLWDSGTCSVTPDQDGIFSTGLGSDCGSEITSNVFSENSNVWLQVQIGAETLSPRQSIKTVPYALNSETVQGYPASASAVENTLISMNNSGEIVLGNTNPVLKSTGTSFSLEGRTLTLRTTAGSNGNITLSPDGIGKIIATKYIEAPGATLSATYAGGIAQVLRGGPSGTADITQWQNSTGTVLSVVNSAGNFGIGTSNPGMKLDVVGGTARVVSSGTPLATSYDLSVQNPSSSQTWLEILNNGGTNKGAFFGMWNNSFQLWNYQAGDISFYTNTSASNGTERLRIQNNGNIAVGTTGTANFLFDVNGTVGPHVDSSYNLGSLTYAWANIYGDALYQNGYQVCDSSGNCPTGTNYWRLASGAFSPINDTADLLIGANATTSAKFAFINVNSGTPTASISGNLAVAVPTSTNPATTYTALNGGSINFQTSVGGPSGASSGIFIKNDGNIGIGSVSPAAKLDVAGTIRNSSYVALGSDTGSGQWGLNSARGINIIHTAAPAAGTGSVGIRSEITRTSDGTGSTINAAYYGRPLINASGLTVDENATYYAANGSITAGTMTNQYGLYVAGLSGATNNYAVYTAGSTRSYFGGNVGIGTNNPANFKLQLTGDIGPTTTATYDLGSATYKWNNIYGTTIYQGANQVCDTSGNCPTGTNYWRFASGAFSPINDTADLLIGANATTSAKFAFINVNSGTPTASISGNLAISSPTGAAPATTYDILNNGTFNLRQSPGGNAGLTSRLFISNNGNVGINTTSPAARLSVVDQRTNPTTTTNGIEAIQTNTYTSSGSISMRAIYGELNPVISSGVSNTGTLVAGSFVGIRNSASDQGSLSNLKGLNVDYGHDSSVNSSATSTNIYGIYLLPKLQAGTISNMYDIYIGTQATGATITNRWGFYQENTSPNYFAGNIGIGTSNPTAKLNVAGNVNISGNATVSATYAGGIAQVFRGGPSGTADITQWQNSTGTVLSVVNSAGNFGIGTSTAANFKVEVLGSVGPQANNLYDLGSATYKWANVYATAFTQNGNAVCDSSGNCPGALNYWRLNSGTLSPINDTADLLIGANATTSAKFAFINVNSGTPTASISGNLALSSPTGAAPATTYDILNNGTFNLRQSPGGNAGLTSRLFISNNGNVGINTTSPGGLLEVNGTNANYTFTTNSTSGYTSNFHMDNTGLRIGHNSGSRDIEFQTSSTTRMTIAGGGNVGIGVTTPTNFKLQLTGDIGPTTTAAHDLGSATYKWNNIYGTTIYQGANQVCDTSNNCGTPLWENNSNVINPRNEYASIADLVVGGNSTASADFRVTGLGNGSTNLAGYTYGRRFIDIDSTSYYVEPGNTTTAALFAGNVGIGSTSANTTLKVYHATTPTFQVATSGTANIGLYYDGGANDLYIGGDTSQDGNLNIKNLSGTTAVALSSSGLSYLNGGNVGVGTSSPNSLLEVFASDAANTFPSTASIKIANGNSAAFGRMQSLTFGTTGGASYIGAGIAGIYDNWNVTNGAGHTLAFFTKDSSIESTPSEKMRINRSGNLGIGTTSPGAKLELYGAAEGIRITGSGTTGDVSSAYLTFYDSNGSTRRGFVGDGATSTDDIYLKADTGDIHIGDSSSATALNLSGGNVSIGTTSSSGKLYTYDGSDNTVVTAAYTGARTNPLFLATTTTSSVAPTGFDFYSWYSAWGPVSGGIRGSSGSGTWESQIYGTQKLVLNAGGYSSSTADIMIDLAGNVGIGTTSTSYKLDVSGDLRSTANVYANDKVITSRYGSAGTYVSTEVQGIWSIGDSYQIDTGADTFGSLYGMGYAYNQNGGSPFASEHQIVFTNNGTINAAIGLSGSGYFGGNVSVGTTNANTTFKVYNNATPTFQVATSATANVGLYYAGGGNDLYLGGDATQDGTFSIKNLSGTTIISLNADSGFPSYINNTTNFGIGTTSPNAKLNVAGNFNVSGNATVSATYAAGIAQVFRGGPSGTGDITQWQNSSGTVLSIVNSAGNIGIGTTAAAVKLDVTGTIQTDLVTSTNNFALCHESNTTLTNQDIKDCSNTPTADYMEFYSVDTNVTPGDLLAPSTTYVTTNDGDQITKLTKTTQEYQRATIGVASVPENAGDFNSIGHNIKDQDNPFPIALNGRVLVKVTSRNGNIQPGDYLTSSNIPGVAMKSTQPGWVIGKAIAAYDNPDTNAIGTVMIFVNSGWYDPSIRFSAEGDLVINSTDENNFSVTPIAGGPSLDTIVAGAAAVVGKLRAGLITTQNLVVTQTVTIAGQTIQDLIATMIDQRMAGSPLVASQTQSLEALVAQEATISGTLTATTTNLGALLADNATISGTVATTSLTAQTATISGDLTAENILITGSSRMAHITAEQAVLDQLRANTAQLLDATISGTLYAGNIADLDQKIATAIQQPGFIDALTGTVPNPPPAANPLSVYDSLASAGYTPTNPEFFAENEGLSLIDGDVLLDSTAVFVRKYLEVNGLAYISQTLGVGESIVIGSGTQISDGVVAYTAPVGQEQVLHIQPSGTGSIELLAGVLTIEHGQVRVTGDLTVAGRVKTDTLLTNLIQPANFGNPFQVQVAGISTQSGQLQESRFEIVNELGTPVATISAKGKADFAGGIGVGSESLSVPTVSSGSAVSVIAESTSGKAKVQTGTNEITIESNKISQNSLIYITPLGSTQNQVLYVKSQTAENPETAEHEGKFVVGFDQTAVSDVNFNWWIVN
ncbi:hypothetical protein KA082_00870 [Candidatus Woesebacteria bacterium]|nr:hypothetical protein [Candidatus Woesebacteria bacterium]